MHIVGEWTARDDVTIVCLVCQATADEEQFDTWMGTGTAVQRLYDAGAIAALRRRFRIAVAHQLDAADVDLAAMTEDERFAAVSDAMKKIDVEMLAALVCIDLDIGPLPPSPRVDGKQ